MSTEAWSAAELAQLFVSDKATLRDWIYQRGYTQLGALEHVLTFASEQIGQQPAKSEQLASVVVELSQQHNFLHIIPTAYYLQAQAQAMQGQFAMAQTLIAEAHALFLQQERHVEAWRTTVGLMRILGETGRLQEAVSHSDRALRALSEAEGDAARETRGHLYKNQGLCHHQLGQYDEALVAYQNALAFSDTFPALEQQLLAANQALTMAALGRFGEAIKASELVIAAIDAEEHPVVYARQLMNLGHLYQQTGQYRRALATLTEAQQRFQTHSATIDLLYLSLDLGAVYSALNLHPEALAVFEQAHHGFEAFQMPFEAAQAQQGLGTNYLLQGAHRAAGDAYRAAAAQYQQLGNHNYVAQVLVEWAGLLLQQASADQALTLVQRAQALAETPLTIFYTHLRSADVFLAHNQVAEAEQVLLSAQATLETLAQQLPHLDYLVEYRFGRLRFEQNRLDEAEQHLLQTISNVEQLRSRLHQELLRSSFLADKVNVYATLAQLYMRRGDEHSLIRAFEVTEQAKARTLVDMMLGLVDRQANAGLSAEQSQQLQTLRRNLNALYNQMLDESQTDRGTGHRLQLQARQIEQTIRHIQLQSSSQAPPRLSQRPNLGATLSFDTLRRQLATHHPIINYHLVNEQLHAFILYKGSLRIVQNLCSLSELRPWLFKLQSQWNRLRVGYSFAQPHLARFERSAQRVLRALYDLLFKKIAPELAMGRNASRQLTIIPHGVLRSIPFQALFDGQCYLVDRYAISYALSVSVLALCHQQTPPTVTAAVAFGASTDSLQQVSAELTSIAATVSTTTYTQEAATIAQLKDVAGSADVLHIATHGLFRNDNPTFSAVKLHDGWLTADDISQLSQVAAHVTLSACESGRADSQVGDEGFGLVRAFLSAGAKSLLVTQWLVQDKVAAILTPQWYAALKAGVAPAQALQHVQQTIREQFPHPYYWAPFMFVG